LPTSLTDDVVALNGSLDRTEDAIQIYAADFFSRHPAKSSAAMLGSNVALTFVN
jgi:hypothetical protein